MDEAVRKEIEAIAADSRSGATAILSRAVALLQGIAADRASLAEAAEKLCHAQPSMAGLRTASLLIRNAADAAAALDAFAARLARSSRVIARLTVGLLTLRRTSGPVRIVTCSRSHTVEQAILAVAREVVVEVCCAESRPGLEGRELAAALARAGVPVVLYTDAALASAIPESEVFLTGADAVGPDAFMNKVGSSALAALAAAEGVPTYVLAGREKFVPASIFASLTTTRGSGADIWPAAPPGVSLSNPYFESIRSSSVSAFVTDAGVLPPTEIPELIVI